MRFFELVQHWERSSGQRYTDCNSDLLPRLCHHISHDPTVEKNKDTHIRKPSKIYRPHQAELAYCVEVPTTPEWERVVATVLFEKWHKQGWEER